MCLLGVSRPPGVKTVAEALRGGAQGKFGIDAQAARLVDGGEELLADLLERGAALGDAGPGSGARSSSPAVAARRWTLRA